MNRFPLSPAQKRLWFLHTFEEGSTAYNLSTVWLCRGSLDRLALQRAFNEVISRHETLRSLFIEENGIPYQVVKDQWFLELPLLFLTQDEIDIFCESEPRNRFELRTAPAIRAHVIRLNETRHVVVVTLHHIICDGWSLNILLREVVQLYKHYKSGQPHRIAPLKVQYHEAIEKEAERIRDSSLASVNYWREQLRDLPFLELPTKRDHSAEPSYSARKVFVRLSTELTTRLKKFAQNQRVTLFMALFAGYQLMLSRWSGQQDFAVGVPIANRRGQEQEELIGLFLNELILRVELYGVETVEQLLSRVRKVCLEAYAHQDLPLDEIVKELNPERALERAPMFQASFALQNAGAWPMEEIADLRVEPLPSGNSGATTDLHALVWEEDGCIEGHFLYAADLFARDTVERMSEHWKRLLEGISEGGDKRIEDLEMLSSVERWEVLYGWNDTGAEYGSEKCVQEVFEEQAAKRP
ncbi:MAG: hypothetical protein JO340_06875, partial [Acidobacteriaceae bacterium]|nr:hypothetical protein [Acidobacteriaceae bacterium]